MKYLQSLLAMLAVHALPVATFGANASTVDIINSGVGGGSSTDCLRRFDRDVIEQKPDVVVMLIGTNDAVNPRKLAPLSTYRENMKAMVSKAKAAGIKVVLVTPPPCVEEVVYLRHDQNVYEGHGPAKRLEEVAAAVRELAAAEGVPLADFRALLLERNLADAEATSVIRNLKNANAKDGVHPTPEGYQILGQLVYDTLKGAGLDTVSKIVCLGDSITQGANMKGVGTITGDPYPAVLHRLLNGETAAAPQVPPAGGAEALTIGNEYLKLGFRPLKEGGGIQRAEIPAGENLINAPEPTPWLWEVQMRKIPQGPPKTEFVAEGMDPETAEGDAKRTDDGEWLVLRATAPAKHEIKKTDERLTLRWIGLDVGDENGVLDVWVSFYTKPGGRFLFARAGIDNRSKVFTVYSLQAPILSGIFPKDGLNQKDFLVTPSELGRLVRDPIGQGLMRRQPGKVVQEVLEVNRASHSMQFDAWYDEKGGLYFGTFDPDLNAIRYAMKAEPTGGLAWAPVHLPNNMKAVPQIWETPYDTVFTSFHGDWFDAAQLYRKWALKKEWASGGPLSTRKDVPKWFKDADEISSAAPGDAREEYYFNEKWLAMMKPFKLVYYVPNWGNTGLRTINTPDIPIRPEDEAFFARLKSLDIPFFGYLQAVEWDIESPSFRALDGRNNTIQTYQNSPVLWNVKSEKKKNSHDTAKAMPGDAWEKALADTTVRMAKAGFNGVYLDSGNHAGSYLNFNAALTPETGGGNYYIQRHRQILKAIRTRTREVDPTFIMTAESFWEGNIDVLDGFFAVNASNRPLESDRVTSIPLAKAVYGDYTVFYSYWINRGDQEQDGAAGYLAKFGEAFVNGVISGSNEVHRILSFQNHDLAFESSRRRYEATSVSKPFLVEGQMLRPPKLIGAPPLVPVKWYRSYSQNYFDVLLPPVMTSVWRAPDGRFGFVAYNITLTPQSIRVSLANPEYQLPAEGKLVPVAGQFSKGTLTKDEQGKPVLELQIEGASPAVYAIE